MSLEIGTALSRAIGYLTTTAGLALAGAYAVVQLLSTASVNTLLARSLPQAPEGAATRLTLPLPVPAAAVLLLLTVVASLLLVVFVLRTVAHDPAELDSLPAGVTDRLAATALSLFVANVVVGLAVTIGFLLLVLPGIFLAVSLAFTQVHVAVEGEGPLEAMSSSWSLARGDRIPLFLLGLAVFAISIAVGLLGAGVSVVSPTAGTVVQVLTSSVLFVYGNAVLVDAYEQLESAEEAENGLDSESPGALTAEDLES